MGYFSNGSEGDSFKEANCNRCVHAETCPIMTAHHVWNYAQHHATPEGKRTREILDVILPRDADGFTCSCPMLHEKTAEEESAKREASSRLSGVNKPAPWIQDFLASRAEAKP